MGYRLDGFRSVGLDEALLSLLIEEHRRGALPRLNRFWAYFRNDLEPVAPAGGNAAAADPPRWYRLAQEAGLPPRLRGRRVGPLPDDRETSAAEVVIENDIAWRIHTMVDFMLGSPVRILSTAEDPGLARAIERVLDAVWEASGGHALLQDAALLGHVYGHVDLLLRLDEPALAAGGRSVFSAIERGGPALSDLISIETVEPRRGIPLLSPADYRALDAYVIRFERALSAVRTADAPSRKPWRRRGESATPRRATGERVEIIGRGLRQVYEDGELIEERTGVLLPGVVPVAHIQNESQPFRYEGLGEVERLIPLQDELNTRLSDRASRVTMQSFKMYLAKRLDGFLEQPVAPGRIWSTDDPDASIEAFGGDAESPGERDHIEQVREAMDKVSGVPPLAGGVIRARIGNLSSANALRVTLLSLLAKTARKRITYGAGIERISRWVLEALDAAGVLRTAPADRGLTLVWPEPAPLERADLAEAAEAKLGLGVPRERVLAELGYGRADGEIS